MVGALVEHPREAGLLARRMAIELARLQLRRAATS
jgi:hypothetical protein